jgi:hypothetical protein
MDIEAYFRSISSECETLKNRVRMLINDEHWPTDGEWKESVLRSIIRRSAPDSVTVGRGFIVAPDWQSTQIDVLVYDNTHPVLYRDGDLVFVSPAACRAIVEVKSAMRSATQFREAASKLARDASRIRQTVQRELFVGLFAYESIIRANADVLGYLQQAAAGDGRQVINHVVLGSSGFVKYWQQRPENGAAMYNCWHLYELNNMAAGYFVHNLIGAVCHDPLAQRGNGWFPRNGKEPHLVTQLGLVAT